MELRSAAHSQHKSFHNAQHCANEALMTGNFVEQLGNSGSVLVHWSDCGWRKTLVPQR
jgi:hypothetical protein